MIAFHPPLMCLVTQRTRLAPGARTLRDECLALEEQIAHAVDAGVDLIHVREPDMEAGELSRLVTRLMTRTRGRATLVVNDRADVAMAAGADGVHLRADGPPADRLREFGPAGWIVGRSIHTTAEARQHGDADYLIFGTVFESGSKPAGSPVAGLDALADAAVVASVPVLAIGGVTPSRVAACRDAGAAGVAAIELFLPKGVAPAAMGPVDAVAAVRAAWREPARKLR